MTPLVIRAFRPGDGQALADLHRRAILSTPETFYTPAEKESWASGLRADAYTADHGSLIEVAVDADDRPVAFCHNGRDEIFGLYVDPDWQGRGVGAELLARAERAIGVREHGTVRVKATVSALPFYRAHGYETVRHTRHKTRGGMLLASVLLEKVIADEG
jgi:GNAT superfamily N-acetyltransferase